MDAPERAFSDVEVLEAHVLATLELDARRPQPHGAQVVEPAFLDRRVSLAPCIEPPHVFEGIRPVSIEPLAPECHARSNRPLPGDGDVRRAVGVDEGRKAVVFDAGETRADFGETRLRVVRERQDGAIRQMQFHFGAQLNRLLRQPFPRRHHDAPAARRCRRVDSRLEIDRPRVRVRHRQPYRAGERVLFAGLEEVGVFLPEPSGLHAHEPHPVVICNRRDSFRQVAPCVGTPHVTRGASHLRKGKRAASSGINKGIFFRRIHAIHPA